MTFAEMKAAKAWGLSPSRWYLEPRWSRATMVAFERMDGNIKYWLAEDKID